MSYAAIAKMCETTVSTVSKAFHNSPEISEKTKEKVYNAAKALGVFDKYYTGKKEKKLIGILCPEPESETYGMLVGSIERFLYKNNAQTLVGIFRFDSKRKAELYSQLIYQANADGVIVIGSSTDLKNPDNIPTVFIKETADCNLPETAIAINVYETMEKLVCFLKNQGYRKIGFIGEKLTLGRLKAFKSAMRKEGLSLLNEYIYISDCERFAEAGVEGMKSFIKNGNIPEVIITAYDNIAFGAMKVAKQNGISIPNDVSFIGINDITPSEYMDVPLSSIETNYAEVAKIAVEVLLSKIDKKHTRTEKNTLFVPTKLNLRRSVKVK